jgi:hypothetical protein
MATIYKIYCRDIEIKECYVGSTEEYDKRCRGHKTHCNNTNDGSYNLKVYKYIRANGGWDNFIIEQIIDCEIEDRYDAELYYFKLFKATLNSHFPKRNLKEWYIDSREQLLEQRKIKIECECGSVVRKSDISTHRKSIKHQNYINSKL